MKIKVISWNVILVRAVRTFFQSLLAAVIGAAVFDYSVWQGALVAGLAAVLSYLHNVVTQMRIRKDLDQVIIELDNEPDGPGQYL
jgi:L-asparagine transporter-like permease